MFETVAYNHSKYHLGSMVISTTVPLIRYRAHLVMQETAMKPCVAFCLRSNRRMTQFFERVVVRSYGKNAMTVK